jgi:hypothetical protein
MSIATLIRYLAGNRDAILKIAATPTAIWLGAVLVFSAALAREYDGKDLIDEPWHVLVPFVASLLTSFLLFCLVYAIARLNGIGKQPFFRSYRSFLALYWMTAPLAWLYGIPVERFLSPGNAMRANLCLLAIVAAWRVALMVRVVTVLFSTTARAAVWPVMLFADTIVLVVLRFTPLPMVQMMGGIRLSEREQVVADVAFWLASLSVVTWLAWLIGTIATCFGPRNWTYALADVETRHAVKGSAWILAALSIAAWSAFLPLTQPPQRLRRAVEAEFASGRFQDAIHLMAAHGPEDFPPHWEPPPHIAYERRSEPPLLDVIEVVLDTQAPAWLQEIYADKLAEQMSNWIWLEETHDKMDRLFSLLRRLPQGRDVVLANVDRIVGAVERWGLAFPERRADADALLDWAGYRAAQEERP